MTGFLTWLIPFLYHVHDGIAMLENIFLHLPSTLTLSLKHVKNIFIRYHLHQVIYIISSLGIPVEYKQDLLPIRFALNHLVVIQKQPSRGILTLKSAISIKLQSSFIEITLQHGCFPVNLLTPCFHNTPS